jgi:hypothetical protein
MKKTILTVMASLAFGCSTGEHVLGEGSQALGTSADASTDLPTASQHGLPECNTPCATVLRGALRPLWSHDSGECGFMTCDAGTWVCDAFAPGLSMLECWATARPPAGGEVPETSVCDPEALLETQCGAPCSAAEGSGCGAREVDGSGIDAVCTNAVWKCTLHGPDAGL